MSRFSAVRILALACGLLAGKSQADEPSKCSFLKIAELPITQLRDDIAIPVSIDGKDVLMEISTGLPFSYLFRNKMKELDLKSFPLRGPDTERAAGYDNTRVDSLTLGKWKALHGTMFVTQVDVTEENQAVAGVLGEDFLQNVDFEIDLKNNRFLLYHAEGCSEKSPPLAPDTYAFIPFKLANSQYWAQILFEVEINGHPVQAILGTEHTDTRLTEEAAMKLDIDLKAAQPIGADLVSDRGGGGLWLAKLDSFKIGDEAVRPVKLRIGGYRPENRIGGYAWFKGVQEIHWDLMLGSDFLRAHRVMVSHSQKRLYFVYQGGPIFGREASAPKAGP